MLEEEKGQTPSRNLKTFSRSVSVIECSPRKSNPKSIWNSKARACFPPLQPLSIVRPNTEEWPRAASDDLGVWPNPPTPGARLGSLTPCKSSTTDLPPREFEFRKDKLAFFDNECSRILDHIYVGSNAVAKNREVLRHNGITHLLNCAGFVCPEYFRNEIIYRTLWLQDSPCEDITSILYDVFDYLEDVREQGGRVLVHCYQGVSRSTSLVIAYLIWKYGQTFDDAFQQVKAARGVTNPNVGFACQLMQWEKRVHALPASPTSMFRMYVMSPHSPYDPLHLVPKLLCEPGADRLDSRGAFIIHFPSVLYVWIGKHCPAMMVDDAIIAASQVIHYEKAQGPVITVKEGGEPLEFWDALCYGEILFGGCLVKSKEKNKLSAEVRDGIPNSSDVCFSQRKLHEYDLDFELFGRALATGVVPVIHSSDIETETCLPARENDWNTSKRKFGGADVPTNNFGAWRKHGGADMMDRSASPHSSLSYSTGSINWVNDNLKEMESPDSLSNTFLSCSSPHSLLDSFSRLIGKPESSSTSPSLSPSTSSDYSSSYSPSSSNQSDMSFTSAQPLSYGFNHVDTDPRKSDSLE